MSVILYALIITSCIVYVYDYVAFPRNFLARLYSWYFNKEVTLDRVKLPKLLECSLCASTWSTLILFLVFNWKLAPLCLVFGWSTKYILDIFNIISIGLDKIIAKIFNLIQ